MNKKQFNIGDKVYCPTMGNKIFTIKSGDYHKFPLVIIVNNIKTAFTKEGHKYIEHKVPSIFKANKENQELLSKLYGIEFEKPLNFLDYHLSLGSKVLCLVIHTPKELPEKIWEIEDKKDMAITIISKKTNDTYYSEAGLPITPKYIFPIAIDSKGNIEYLSI